ncbi:sugar ABC transporter ATP-binding protein [Embleya sp. NPDC020886]|uniref:sugar ABC transporter ATP-binding protein n=1 Tax=Embleya sp. NPDC020886 TaxID=3363980 RepID=UPI0037AFDE03
MTIESVRSKPVEPVDHTSLLEMRGISKRFGGLQALDDVSITLRGGEVLALCGANGAGKSTLVRILAGVEQADGGEITLDGRVVSVESPQQAADLGLNFVHQELNLVPKFTGLQNMALGSGTGRAGFVATKALRRRAGEVRELLGYDVPLDVPVEKLSVSDRWMVSLARSLMRPARFIAMDEPTASFTQDEADLLYGVIRELTTSGVGVLYISHRLEEILLISDEVATMRDGRVVGSHRSDRLDVVSLTRHIVGHEVEEPIRHADTEGAARAPVRLAVRGLGREGKVSGATFDLHVGEVLGVAGLAGAGRTELARLLIGADRPSSGTMMLDGARYAPRSPHDAIRSGVALVPEERRSQGLLLGASIDTNLAVAAHGRARTLFTGFSPRSSRRTGRQLAERFAVKTDDTSRPVLSLSGGNQQKVVLAKYVRTGPSVLVLDEPTVGVDVGARAEIYETIAGLAREGTSILLISSDFDELAVCDRVLVMRHGALVADVPGARATKALLTRLCFQSGELVPDDSTTG